MENNNTNKQSIIGFILIGVIFFAYMLYNSYQMEKYNEQLALEQATEQVATQMSEQVEIQKTDTAEVQPKSEVIPDPFILRERLFVPYPLYCRWSNY